MSSARRGAGRFKSASGLERQSQANHETTTSQPRASHKPATSQSRASRGAAPSGRCCDTPGTLPAAATQPSSGSSQVFVVPWPASCNYCRDNGRRSPSPLWTGLVGTGRATRPSATPIHRRMGGDRKLARLRAGGGAGETGPPGLVPKWGEGRGLKFRWMLAYRMER